MNTQSRTDVERIAQSTTPFFLTVEDPVHMEVERLAMTHGNSLKTQDARERPKQASGPRS